MLPVPAYDRTAVRAGIVHIGVGGFHRAHQAMYHDRLLAAGASDWGICGMGLLPPDARMRDALAAQDGLYTLVVKHPDGAYEPRVIGSLVEYVFAPDDPAAAIERLASPATRIVSMTITEGGYHVDEATMTFAPGSASTAVFAHVVEALRLRRERGVEPFAVVSCDNLTGNGDIARAAFAGFARGLDAELGDWVRGTVDFPNSVVDRIAPATTGRDRDELRERTGIDDRWPVVCEPFAQWVVEDTIAGARPPWEQAGVLLTDDVLPYERMKLRLLNAGHQAVAYFGRLCGHRFVHDAARDPGVRAFLEGYLHEEASPSLGSLPPDLVQAFRDRVPDRFSNPAIGDTIERLAYDASHRIPKFVLPVIRDQLESGGSISRATAIVAAWARCLEGTDEAGEPIVFADSRGAELVRRAHGEQEDPRAFIGYREVFGNLGDDPRFAAAYGEVRALLRDRGARATLAALA